jgi:iron complex outermembrane receptor protein
LLLLAVPAWAAGTLEVRVSDPGDRPLPGVTVGLVGTTNECVTNAEGVCRFEALAARTYQVTAHLSGFIPARADAPVEEGKTASIPVRLSTQVHFSESVTVSPGARDVFESYQPATVLGGEELSQNLAPTLGETLGKQVGVNMRAFGPGPSRPVIRGLDGDRVLILENGARTGDLSSQSADHGVTLDPASANQIEVVRGPATLLYGSNALGGVVNIVSDEIPNKPVKGARGNLTLQGGTANEEAGAAGNITGGNGSWAFRAGGSANRTGNVKTPEGDIPNSQSNMKSGGASAGYTADNGYAGLAYQYVDNRYGTPFVEEGGTTLHPRRHRVDFRAERRGMPGWIEGIKALAGYRNYTHDEIEASGEIATTFKNKFTEGELLLNHRAAGRLKGTIGGWATHRDYSSLGEESLAPPTTQNAFAGFLYEELTFDRVSIQFGGRVDHTKFSPEGAVVDRPELTDRTFTEFSGSVGLVGRLSNELTLAVNVARAARNPSLEELYNNGPHVGNFAFEIGNPDLPSERGIGVDVSLRYRARRFFAEGTYFRNSIDKYIFAFPTGEEEDGLRVVNFLSADSLLQGFELHTDIGLSDSVWLELGGDGVHAELRDLDQPLPRIPPYRGWAALRYESGGFHIEGEVRGAAKQDRIFGGETPTAGYAILNGHASYTFTSGKAAHTVTLRLGNATDKLYRNHLSFIKDLAPEMGRTVKLVYALRF